MRPNIKVGAPLSAREIAVLALVCEGFTDKEIGRDLKISSRTVDAHRIHLRIKLGAKNTAHMVALAMNLGCLNPVEAS